MMEAVLDVHDWVCCTSTRLQVECNMNKFSACYASCFQISSLQYVQYAKRERKQTRRAPELPFAPQHAEPPSL
jgi:hypothetical protein